METSADPVSRSSIHQVAELVKTFMKTASTAHSSFHVEKADGNPAIMHVAGASGFEKAKHAVERDLKHVMRAHASQEGSVTYSVHYTDVNGLSRLENYILGLEIAQYFGMSKSYVSRPLLRFIFGSTEFGSLVFALTMLV